MLHLFPGGVVQSVGDVVGHAAGEQNCLLCSEADLVPEGLEIILPVVDSIDEDLPFLGIVKTRDQIEQRGFAAAS